MKNNFKVVEAIGGSIVYGFQGEDCILERGYGSLKENKNLEKIKSFLGIKLDSDIFGIYSIRNKDNKELLCGTVQELNFQLVESFDGFYFSKYIFHNKKVKVVELYFGDLEMWLVNLKDTFPEEKYEIRSQDWKGN